MKNEKTLEQLQEELETAKKAYEFIQKKFSEKEKEEREQAEAKLAAEKESRYAEIKKIEKKRSELIRAYIKDYGSYNTTRAHNEDGIPYLWHMFF